MVICLEENCTCIYHRLLHCMENGLNEESRLILQNVKDFRDVADTSRSTLLHYSVIYGNVELSQYLINEGCKVNTQDNSGTTPLLLAVKKENVEVTEMLLENNGDIYVTDSDGISILQHTFNSCLSSPVVHFNDNLLRIVKILFSKVNHDFLKDKERVKEVLLNASISEKLIILALGSADSIRFMMENRYPIDFIEPTWGCTALHCSMRWVRIESVKVLIEYGANVDTLDKEGYSSVYHYTGKVECVDEKSEVLKMLLKKSTRLSLSKREDSVNMTSLGELENLLLLGRKETVKTILMSDIDVDACLTMSLMSLLEWNRYPNVLEVFSELDIKVDLHEAQDEWESHLMLAARRRGPEFVRFFLEHGADVNFSSPAGSALSYATIKVANRFGQIELKDFEVNEAKVTELLLLHGADVHNPKSLIDNLSNGHENQLYTKVIVSHLALLGALDPPALPTLTREKIKSGSLKKHFDFYKQQLEDLKQCKVQGSLTIFKLLTEREDKLVVHARNPELTSAFDDAKKKLSHIGSYYMSILEKRVSEIVVLAKVQGKVSLIIDALTGLNVDVYHVIIYKIIGYLDRSDLNNLCEIGNILNSD